MLFLTYSASFCVAESSSGMNRPTLLFQVRDLTGEAFSRFMREVYDSIHTRIRRSGPIAHAAHSSLTLICC